MKESHKLVPPISETHFFCLYIDSSKLQYSQIIINAILFIHFQIVNRMANLIMICHHPHLYSLVICVLRQRGIDGMISLKSLRSWS